MNPSTPSLLTRAASLLLLTGSILHADDRSTWLSAATDSHGVHHRGADYGGRRAPWIDGALAKTSPVYPQKEKEQRHAGSGLFRLSVDLKTGAVTKVTVVQSTGYRALDDAAIASFRGWRWKPGQWREVDMPITFTLASPR
jgi:TonB family protein